MLASLANSRMRTDDMEGAAGTAREAVAVAAEVGPVAQQADALITDVSNILAKLNVSSRTEVAVHAHRLGLLAPDG